LWKFVGKSETDKAEMHGSPVIEAGEVDVERETSKRVGL
jgi:hypothetical protein